MIINKIEEAKTFFGIVDYPGDLFNVLNNSEYIYKYRLLIFKEDIDKLSGFIGYNNNFIMICVNYKRNIGHQNFTLAHELGHMFLHPGVNKTDVNPESSNGSKVEEEANLFASELIYPANLAKKDYQYAKEKNLFLESNWVEFSTYLNFLCEKYCTSFLFTFNKISSFYFNNYREKNKFYKKFKKTIGKLSVAFPRHLHVVDESHAYYKRNLKPYKHMEYLIDELTKKNEIGFETGAAIKERYLKLEEKF